MGFPFREVTGAPEEDKNVCIEIELHALDGELEGAVRADTRIFSEIGTFTDLYPYPVGVPSGTQGSADCCRWGQRPVRGESRK